MEKLGILGRLQAGRDLLCSFAPSRQKFNTHTPADVEDRMGFFSRALYPASKIETPISLPESGEVKFNRFSYGHL